ncbi:glycosyltransferase [Colwellia sp. MSW7]|uniref:Glycosyltransferase n=1 Tax=Colwellia maritima TaxID=2912588 RepID=A0ABS9X5I1_9GAMM|nr:glycosyltransferase [Colwellia maritima]MCI2285479.1 glycosyltransferase [Colwellia maritima]
MSERVIFSVVIPLYNRANIVEKVINSVIAQTCQDFEIIIVDDGSKDNAKEVIDNIRDNRIRYIYQENGGGSKARNTGIDNAKGKYVAFLDSDDVFLPHHLETSLEVLEQGNNICTYAQVIVDRGEGVRFLKPDRAMRSGEHISEYLMCDRGFVPTITLVIPTWLAKKSKYDEKISAGQDYDMAIKLVANGGHLKMLPDPGAIWDDQWCITRLSSKAKPEQRLEWLNRIRPMLIDRAYWAELGWPIAKGFASQGHKFKALGLYLKAVFNGAYRPKMMIVIFLQVILSKNLYRKFSDILAKFGIKP